MSTVTRFVTRILLHRTTFSTIRDTSIPTGHYYSYPLVLVAFWLAVLFAPARGTHATETVLIHPAADSLFVVATGPAEGTTLEDRVEVMWGTVETVDATSTFSITRDGVLIRIAAPTETILEDLSAVPNVEYTYCVTIIQAGGTATPVGCDIGARRIARPTGFGASDGMFEGHVLLSWTDRSEIEGGYNVYRDAGNALTFDGIDDWVETSGITDLAGSFSFDFWARRASTGTDDFVIDLDTYKEGDKDDVDLEVGFNAANRFHFGFGEDVLATAGAVVDADWHHWAIAYDAPNRRRLIYRDGVRIATDVTSEGYAPTGILTFGRQARKGKKEERGHFDGYIDEIRYWDVALTEDDVAAQMSGLLGGSEAGLVGYWPMDVASGLVAPDVVGDRHGTLENDKHTPPPGWVPTGVPDYRAEVGADLTAYVDRTAVVGFMTYDYRLAAYEDVDRDGTFRPKTDFESEQRYDDGWRAFLTPPAHVSATDGQFLDRVRVTWRDRSTAETSYRVYRDGAPIGSVSTDSTRFEDASPTAIHEYCVAAFASGIESIRMCDQGMAGNLPRPADVVASRGAFDDRVAVTWADTTDTEDGFELFRDAALLATLDANAEEFNDFSAAQGVEYDYCVRAFSKADPLNPSYSAEVCADSTGFRAVILDPTNLTATKDDYEDRVEMSWQNPSTTAMLFLVYRDSVLIEVLDFNMTYATDSGIPSDSSLQYCVSSATVVTPSSTVTMQKKVAQVLYTIRHEDAVHAKTGGTATSIHAKMAAVYDALGLQRLAKNGATADTSGFVESGHVCDRGSRSIRGPTDVDASDDDFENHVQVAWIDNSQIETGYHIYRDSLGLGSPVRIDTLSADRTTYGDYTGVPGVQYTYTVEAFDDFDQSQVDTDLGRRTLKPPSAFVASDGTSEMIVELDWKDNSSAELGYRIYRRMGTDPFLAIGETGKNEPAFVDSVAAAALGQSLAYEVRAFDLHGESLGVREDGSTKLEAPGNVNASEVYPGKIVVIWVDRSEVETGYTIMRRQVGTSAPEMPVGLPAGTTVYEDPIVANGAGKEFEYCVQATLGGGQFLSDPVCDIGLSIGSGGVITAALQPVRIGSPVSSSGTDRAVRFGASVAVNDDMTALIGAPGADLPFDFRRLSAGMAWRYAFNADNLWTIRQSLYSVQMDNSEFGHDVDMSGDYFVIGNPFGRTDKLGIFTAYRTNEPVVSGGGYVDVDNYGQAVAIVDSFAVIGNDVYDPTPLPLNHGGATICNVESPPGSNCNQEAGLPKLQDLLPSNKREENAGFGFAVDIARDEADSLLFTIVGAPGGDAAYIFQCHFPSSAAGCGAQTDWAFVTELETPYGGKQNFGAAVAINHKFAAVGAPGAEAVVLWTRNAGNWDRKRPFSPPGASVGFGSSVALRDSLLVVGAPGEQIADFEDAGAIYALQWNTDSFDEEVRYDARAGGTVRANARFGVAVDVSAEFYVVGSPGDGHGAVYSIPIGLEPPSDVIVPPDIDIATPGEVNASDGTAPDRIQVRWEDESDGEDGHIVYRSTTDGGFDRLGKTAENVEFFDDFDAAAGEAYTYCVTAFFGASETEPRCDIGWRPPNGTIAGRIAATIRDVSGSQSQGAGTEGAEVCLVPSPNKALLFDGSGGHVIAPVGEALKIASDFTIEAWIRPHAVDGVRFIVSKDSSFALGINNGFLELTLYPGKILTASASAVLAGAWQHVAVSLDRDRKVKFFVDGVPESRTVPSLGLIAGDTLTIGMGRIGETSVPFSGEIDEVRIWNAVQTTDQVAALMEQPLNGDEENLVGYWPLDDGLRSVVPDVTESANHGRLAAGVYLADEGAALDICGITSDDGNYSISGIRYGESTEFNVIPTRPGREFSPRFKKITLATESPVQNEVPFTDVTAYPVSGLVQYVDVIGDDTLRCPVPDVAIHANKAAVATGDTFKDKTRADGSYAVGLDPSTDARDTWFIIPELTDPQDAELVHTFEPPHVETLVTDPVFDVNFNDLLRHELTGHFSGGDPAICGKDIGVATIWIRTEDGCYDREITVDSKVDQGRFPDDLNLPPLNYLLEVVDIVDAPSDRAEDIAAFFEALGAVEVDLTAGDVERNLIYRAPLALRIQGLEEDAEACPAGIVQVDEEGNPLRTLPPVQTIPEYGFKALEITLMEDYGNGEVCGVDDGTATIFDAIGDRVDEDSTIAFQDGVVNYTTFGASPNIFSGARIQGVDRSFQKPITVVAQVEGRKSLTATEWAIVEGYRERAATFVSATTEEFPLLILRDPPGSNSFAFIEKGTRVCNRMTNMWTIGGGVGVDLDIMLGFKGKVGFSFGAHFETGEVGVGGYLTSRTIVGADVSFLDANPFSLPGLKNIETCFTTTETLATSADPGFVGEDIYLGVALNLIFALADVLASESCEVELSETIATDLDNADPFETDYLYGESHIKYSLIPELENLIRIGGDATLNGEIGGEATSVRLEEAVENWGKHLKLNQDLKAEAIDASTDNRSFSGGSDISVVETADTTRVPFFYAIRAYLESETQVGLAISSMFDSRIGLAFEFHTEWNHVEETTRTTSESIGYVLSDGDTGDFFSVDIGTDSMYGTKVFETVSGRSSNPWEANTQKRDNPIILVDPPVLHDVDPEGAGNFQVTLINASESNERRQYTIDVPGEVNPYNLGLTVTGDLLGGERLETFLLDPGKALTINLDVLRVSPPFAYRDVGVMLYPMKEYDIWLGDTRQPFVISDTAFFSVFFDSTGGNVQTAMLAEGWNWLSINRQGGGVDSVLADFPANQGDLIKSMYAETRYDTTAGWTGSLDELTPGQGYRARLQQPGILRLKGEPVVVTTPIHLRPGWDWVGYLPAKRMPVEDALASLAERLVEGDAVVGQNAFAQYVNSVGWVGPLRDMVPGESYVVHLAGGGDLLYPEAPEKTVARPPVIRETTARGPEWQVRPEDHDATMIMVAEIRLSDAPLKHTAFKVALTDGEEVRGAGEVHYVEALDQYLTFVMIYGPLEGEHKLRVHVYDGETDTMYEDVATVHYAAQTMLGQAASPVYIELTNAGLAPDLRDLPETYALYPNYPNPFNPFTIIGYDLPEPAEVTLTVYDVLGRRVVKLVDGEQVAGRHKVVFSAEAYASGLYFYRMQTGDFKQIGKMMLVK